MQVSLDEVKNLLDELFSSRGVENYEIITLHFLEAELRGHSSHGLQRVIPLIKGIDLGTINRKLEFSVEKRSNTTLLIDAKHSIGILLWSKLIEEEKFDTVKVIAVRNASHIGFLGFYTTRLNRKGLVSLMFGNAEAGIVKPGSGKPILSTAPISVGIPPNYVLDMSLASTARGKILEAKRKGEKLNKGIAVNEEGKETEDPDEALKGGILPIGGFKGFLLALTVDLLTSFLTGSAIGEEVTGVLHTERPPNKGEVLIVINPSWFEQNSYALVNVKKFMEEFPGEHGEVLMKERTEKGSIEIDDGLWISLKNLKMRG
ncbi:lactate dehydrogenase [Candidatus Acidianus copahuensis]|uniref:Lactate dehydrogenase n=1 Tax=Candidatus Acidianus copahuensis TaxID=1160895 RepID=A0A031LU69_9CREN|nr:Ldh family oxidoreductase [Candidatus Acidianus copahuensis]EZQ11371.1 lactate dehydrogenase [Candidatus Acidianus copahuensis]